MTFDKELLFKATLPEGEVPVRGQVMRVRGLTRSEVMNLRSQVKSIADAIQRSAELEAKTLALALVDPVLTEDEVKVWQDSSPAGEIEPVVQKVQELSGLLDGAAKEAYREFEQDPDREFRLPPG